jgi:hypothetical protein
MSSMESCSGDGQLRIDRSRWTTFICSPHHINVLITDTLIMATGVYDAKQNIETKAIKSGSNGKIGPSPGL